MGSEGIPPDGKGPGLEGDVVDIIDFRPFLFLVRPALCGPKGLATLASRSRAGDLLAGGPARGGLGSHGRGSMDGPRRARLEKVTDAS